jgi:DNA invertase Pin-like site-specific DNA recombinase
MLADAKLKQFDVLLFWAVDRLSREGVLKTLTYLQELDACGVCWLSHMEPYFDSCGPLKDVVISMMATLAKMEREKISERTKAGLRQAVRNGKTLGQPRVAVDMHEVHRLQASGMKLSAISDVTGVNLRTIMRRLAETK